MSFNIRLFYFVIILISSNFHSFAQLSGNINVGSGQTYTSLTGAGGLFQAINSQGLSGNVSVYITSNTNEDGSNALNQWAGNFTLNISPSSATVRILTGNVAVPLINFNGADNVTIDGRFNGSGKYLRFVNSNAGGTNFRFINDATNNTITYCIIEGTNTSTTSGNIEFSTTTGTTGNDNNTISFSDICDASGQTPVNVIYSNGSTSSTNVYNSNNSILNNNIYNFYRDGQNCAGIRLTGGSTDWTILGNSFYQTAARNNANATGFNCIYITTSNANNITITNNYMGGSSPNCGGSAFTVSGNVGNFFYGIRFSSAGTTTSSKVDENTIANISFAATPSINGTIPFTAIVVEAGAVNIGTLSGNTIGDNSSNGSITLSYSGSSTNNISRGIDQRGRGSIDNNNIGSINIGGTNSGTNRLEVINCTGAQTQDISISNNNIGSLSVTGSIQSTSNLIMQMAAIYSSVNTVNVTMNNNIISNLINISTSSSARLRGIYQNNGTSGRMTINNNTVNELSGAGSSTDRFPNNCSLIGIFTGSSYTNQTVSGNTIRGLRLSGNANNYVQGFAFYNNQGMGTFSQNKIYDLTNSSTGSSPKIYGVNAFWGAWNFYNNMISLTNGETTLDIKNHNYSYSTETLVNTDSDPGNIASYLIKDDFANNQPYTEKSNEPLYDVFTNGAEIKGFHEEAEFGGVYYYNSVYIGGSTTTGNSNTFAFDRPLTAWPTPVLLRNNLFVNARTGGTGSHFALGNEISPPNQNWTPGSSNYNALITANPSMACNWGFTKVTIAQWRDSSGSDKQTWCTLSSDINPSNLFNGISTGNLSINSSNTAAWIVSGKGIAITGQNTDYEGNSRATTISAGCTDIGADEFAATPPNCPAALFDNAPGSGVTSTYTLWNRTISVINWGTGGSSYPSALQVRYYSGVNNPNAMFGNFSNSYWNFTPTGSLTGTTYDITINFGDNETYSITTPSSNIRLAKYESYWYVFAVAGSGLYETELNWANLWAKTRGPNSFSDYLITDGTNPLPVELCSFSANIVNNRAVELNWVTCWEINNMGFDIERRVYNPVNNEYGSWSKIGFAQGHGTTNELITYSFKDSKLTTGKYQYRLKQMDYNSNYEYFNLNSPSEVIIGKPVSADLFQNYPNPSNPSSKVDFQIPFASKVSLRIYDIAGKEVAVLINGQLEGGYYTSEFNGTNLASGIYFYRLIAEGNGEKFSKTLKLVLVK